MARNCTFITVGAHTLQFYNLDNVLTAVVRLGVAYTPAGPCQQPLNVLHLQAQDVTADLALVLRGGQWDDSMCSSSVDDYAADQGWPWGEGVGLRDLMENAYGMA